MSLWQALRYFFTEAAINLARSWRASSLAVLTIAISLYVGGFFLLATGNLSDQTEQWGDNLRVVVYLDEATAEQRRTIEAIAERPAWTGAVSEISSEMAGQRFSQSFPGLEQLLEDWEGAPFPPSYEIGLDSGALVSSEYDSWLRELEGQAGVAMVDDDRDWLAQIGRLIGVVRGLGLAIGVGLLVTAVITIASVIKLTAYLYIEEIEILRLVGATEFYIRGPFYVEGLLQGCLGGAVAVAGLAATWLSLGGAAETSVWLPLILRDFLGWPAQLALIALGTAAGLFGAVVSLRRESLTATQEA